MYRKFGIQMFYYIFCLQGILVAILLETPQEKDQLIDKNCRDDIPLMLTNSHVN